MVVAPRQVNEMRIRARAQYLRLTLGEVLVALAELRYLCRTDEREVHRPEKNHLPPATVRALADLLKLLPLLQTYDCVQFIIRKFLSNCQHSISPIMVLNLDSV